MAVRMGRDGGETSVLAERARSEGARSTRALEVTPFHPVTRWGKEKKMTEQILSVWQ
jgi:hypothetical protein